MNLTGLLEKALASLGYELVDSEWANKGLLRVYIDRQGGVTVDDCARVSNHLTRVFAVEAIAYERLEVSSPGLDRPLTRPQDFRRFEGEKAKVRLRVPLNGQRNFVGVLRGADERTVQIEVDGTVLQLDFAEVEKARLVPTI
ncbi:MAG TPA: ribosome maturation factor RimP [Burkholderiales bacterium]|jgi:ribosome maturation factor RimP|nr:ribosome maturation factor RimP [Burkholderiales bacterium]